MRLTELKTKMERLCAVDGLQRSMDLHAEALVRYLEHLPSFAEELSAAVLAAALARFEGNDE